MSDWESISFCVTGIQLGKCYKCNKDTSQPELLYEFILMSDKTYCKVCCDTCNAWLLTLVKTPSRPLDYLKDNIEWTYTAYKTD